jgi:hypothetical protein
MKPESTLPDVGATFAPLLRHSQAERDKELISQAPFAPLTLIRQVLDMGPVSPDVLDRVARIYADEEQLEVVRFLAARGANLRAHDDQALCNAASFGAADVTEYLLDSGADVHAQGDRPLREAAGSGNCDVVKLLLSRGANVHACGNEALVRAVRHARQNDVVRPYIGARGDPVSIIHTLLNGGADAAQALQQLEDPREVNILRQALETHRVKSML